VGVQVKEIHLTNLSQEISEREEAVSRESLCKVASRYSVVDRGSLSCVFYVRTIEGYTVPFHNVRIYWIIIKKNHMV
jgi:hypothetical protein